MQKLSAAKECTTFTAKRKYFSVSAFKHEFLFLFLFLWACLFKNLHSSHIHRTIKEVHAVRVKIIF